MKTERIYEDNGMIFRFEATVMRCSACGDGYALVLDRTAFFPEGGGQAADTGTIRDARVLDVQIKDGEILHYTDRPVAEGSTVTGQVDGEIRFRRMQNHSGEHVLSGTLHRMYKANNVGFHLGTQDVTVDINVALTREELFLAEEEANRAVARNLPVRAWKPSAEEAERIPYRSKKEIGEDLRLVMIEGVDCCACCAPHVAFTGQIGMIKILDAIHYKGGMRLHILCGLDAERAWETVYRDHSRAAGAMSVRQTEVSEAVDRLLQENAQLRHALREAKRKEGSLLAERVPRDADHALIRMEDADMQMLRETALASAKNRSGVYAACCEDGGTLTFAIAGTGDLNRIAFILRRDFAGRCGGSAALIQGTAAISAEKLEELLSGCT
ncbi:MAG: alanyl-tRNA editing protein [Clostridia bacterium]|nr:alanyl-tRNA editing protein [Clostridia bacterium]